MSSHVVLKLHQLGKESIDEIESPDASLSLSPGDEDILPNGQIRENPPVIRNKTNTQLGDTIGRSSADFLTFEFDAPRLWRGQSDDTLKSGCLPGSIPSEQADRFRLVDPEGDAEEDMTGSVIGVNSTHFENHAAPPR